VLTYWWSPNRVGGRAGPSLVRRGRGNADPKYLVQHPLSNYFPSNMASKSKKKYSISSLVFLS
jgi:hypothetical protein